MIDYEADNPVYEQIAAEIRARIEAGEWQPRRRLPSVTHLEQQYGVARQTVLQALARLRDRGLVYTVKNRGTFVKLGADLVTVLTPESGTRIIFRRASNAELLELDIQEGVSVVVVELPGGGVEVYPEDAVEIRIP